MLITQKWLKDNGACAEGQDWFNAQSETELSKVVKALIKDKKFNWANWTLTRAMNHTQRIQYACYSAKQSLHLFEKTYPKDKRPHLAIKAALKFAKDPSELNRSAAESAARSASSAAWSARSAAWSARSAARSAAWSAESASSAWSARSAESAESAAESAARSAARSASAWKRILKYGLKLCV